MKIDVELTLPDNSAGFDTAACVDEPRMARVMESAYRDLFARWCAAQPKAERMAG